MNTFHFTNPIVTTVIIIFITLITTVYSTSALNEDILFTINITMKNYQTTKVNMHEHYDANLLLVSLW